MESKYVTIIIKSMINYILKKPKSIFYYIVNIDWQLWLK